MVRYDGLYVSPRGDSYSYVRFYKDNTVITVSSTGTPKQVARWFSRHKTDTSIGRYKIQGNQIQFSSTSRHGTVDYSGVVQGDILALHIYSHINGYRSFQEYRFVEVEFPQTEAKTTGDSSTTNEERVISNEEDRIQYYKEILELEGDITVPKLKEAYRSIITKYHPDKVEHLGKEIKELAARKTVQINEAYEYFRDKYSF